MDSKPAHFRWGTWPLAEKNSSTSYEHSDHFITETYVEYTQESVTEERFFEDFDDDDIPIIQTYLNAFRRGTDHCERAGLSSSVIRDRTEKPVVCRDISHEHSGLYIWHNCEEKIGRRSRYYLWMHRQDTGIDEWNQLYEWLERFSRSCISTKWTFPVFFPHHPVLGGMLCLLLECRAAEKGRQASGTHMVNREACLQIQPRLLQHLFRRNWEPFHSFTVEKSEG